VKRENPGKGIYGNVSEGKAAEDIYSQGKYYLLLWFGS
jgi:hypothetical protein